MTLFRVKEDLKDFGELKNYIMLVQNVVSNIELDQDKLFASMKHTVESIREYASGLAELANYDFGIEFLPSLCLAKNFLKKKVEELSKILNCFVEEFREKNNSGIMPSFSVEEIEMITSLNQKIALKYQNIDKTKNDFDRDLKDLDCFKNAMAVHEASLKANLGNRNFCFDEIVKTKKILADYENKKTHVDIKIRESLKNHSKDFEEENLADLEKIERLIASRLETNKGIYSKFYDELKHKLMLFLCNTAKQMKKACENFSPEDDSSHFCANLLGNKKVISLPMYESLNEIDLEEATNQICDKLEKILDKIEGYCDLAANIHKHFLQNFNFDPQNFSSEVTQGVENMTMALRDTFRMESQIFQNEKMDLKKIRKLKETWQTDGGEYLRQNSTTIHKIVKIRRNATPVTTVSDMDAFDMNFLAALDSSRSSISQEPILFDENNDADQKAILTQMRNVLNSKRGTDRRRYLRAQDAFLISSIVWIKNIFTRLLECLNKNAISSKEIFTAQNIFVKRLTFLEAIPKLRRHSDGYMMLQKRLTPSKKKAGQKNSEQKTTPVASEEDIRKRNEEMYESFIGKEEAEKGKQSGKKEDVNFFSFLMDTFEEEVPEGKPFEVSVEPTHEEPTHKLYIDEKKRICIILTNENKKHSEVDLKVFNIVSYSKENKENCNFYRKLSFQNIKIGVKRYYLFGDESTIKRLHATLMKCKGKANPRKLRFVNIDVEVRYDKMIKFEIMPLKLNLLWLRYFTLKGKKILTCNVKVKTNLLKKSMNLHVSKGSTLVENYFLGFKTYKERDCALNYIRKMKENQRQMVYSKNTYSELSVWCGVYTATKIKLKSLKKILPNNEDVIIYTIFGSSNLKGTDDAILKDLNSNKSEKYLSVYNTKTSSNAIIIYMKADTKIHAHSFSISFKNSIFAVQFFVMDSSYLVICSSVKSFYNLKTKTYPEVRKGETLFWDKINSVEPFSIYDLVIWVVNMKSEGRDSSGNSKESDDKLWKKDALNAAYQNKEIFNDFQQVPFKKNAPITKTGTYPTRIFFKGMREGPQEVKLVGNSTFPNADSSITPHSCALRTPVRELPIRYAIENSFEENQNNAIKAKVSELKITPKSGKPMEGDPIAFAMLQHLAVENVFVSAGRVFDQGLGCYHWRDLRHDSEFDPSFNVSSLEPVLNFYVLEKEYLKKTSISLVFGNDEQNLCAGKILIAENFFAPGGNKFEIPLYSKKNYTEVANATGKLSLHVEQTEGD